MSKIRKIIEINWKKTWKNNKLSLILNVAQLVIQTAQNPNNKFTSILQPQKWGRLFKEVFN